MKKLWSILIVFVLILIVYFYWQNSQNLQTKEEITEEVSYENLIQYKTDSINDTTNLDHILNNTELSSYILKKEKSIEDGKEQLIIYYDCADENEIKQYWIDARKGHVTEKNSVILFSLVNNLEKIEYRFTVSNDTYKVMYEDISKEYDRETINHRYNQDVRNYINKPNEFLKYNMDLNTNKITIYTLGFSEYNKFEIIDEEEVSKIKEFIENQNFGIEYEEMDDMVDIFIDFNNGYVIGILDSARGTLIKGNCNELLTTGKISHLNDSDDVHKILPVGFREYIKQIIENN